MPYNLFKNQSPSQSLFSNVGASCLNVDSRSWQPIRLHSNLSFICFQTCQSFILYCSVMKIFIDKLIPPPLHSYFKVNRGTDEKESVGKYQSKKIQYLAITTYQQIFCLIIYIIINYHVQKVWTLAALSWLAKGFRSTLFPKWRAEGTETPWLAKMRVENTSIFMRENVKLVHIFLHCVLEVNILLVLQLSRH